MLKYLWVIFVRVISGIYRGLNLKGFDIDGTRPTMDRIKESMFAMINSKIQNSEVLDLFAGSGSLGIEAISNGAKHCTFIDKNKIAYDTIKENTKKMDNVTIIQNDSMKYLKETNDTFDIILLDPPYQTNFIQKSINIIKERNLLNKGGILVCEYVSERFESPYELWKEKTYKEKTVSIYKNN